MIYLGTSGFSYNDWVGPFEKYDYSYSPEELEEWLPKIRDLDQTAERTFVFANNHWRGQAVATIRQLRMMLD